jgi:hypothetical protein
MVCSLISAPIIITARVPPTVCAVVLREELVNHLADTNYYDAPLAKLTSPRADTELVRDIDITFFIALPVLHNVLDYIPIILPNAPAIRAGHPAGAVVPHLHCPPCLEASLVDILPTSRAAPNHGLGAFPIRLHLAEADRTVPLDRLPFAVRLRFVLDRQRAVEYLAQLRAQQRELVDQVAPRAQHLRQHPDEVLTLVPLARVWAVARGQPRDGHRVDVARGPRQLDFLFRAVGRADACARQDVEALGGGAQVDVFEGLRGPRTEPGMGGVGLVIHHLR